MALVRIDGYPIDVAISKVLRFPGSVTKFPIESGAVGNDHILDLPPEIELTGIVSDLPSGEVASDPTRQRNDPNAPLPSVEALARLREIKARCRPVTIVTGFGTFPSMAFVDLEVTADKERNNALFFTASFEFFNQVTNKRTRVPVNTPMAGAAGKAKSKAVVGKGMVVDAGIIWKHGVPPGTPWKEGNIVERIGVVYGRPDGLSRDTAMAMQRFRPGSKLVTYVYGEGPLAGQPIIGIPRLDLIKDLERDQRLKSVEQVKALNGGRLPNQPALPPGYDLSRIKRNPEDLATKVKSKAKGT